MPYLIPISFYLYGSMQGNLQAKGPMKIMANAIYGAKLPDSKNGVTVNTDMSSLPVDFNFNTHLKANASLGFKLIAEASVASILSLNANAQATAILDAEMKNFPALPTEKLFENTTWSYGSCLNPHYMEYDLRLKLAAHADAKFSFLSSPSYEKDYEMPGSYIILSGCLLAANETNEYEKIYSKFFETVDLARDAVPFTDEVLNVGFANELSNKMSWPKGSIVTSVVSSNNSISGVNVTLYPVTATGRNKYSTRTQLEGRLAEATNDEDSSLYSGAVGKFFKGKFIEQNVESYSSVEPLSSFSSSSILSVSFGMLVTSFLIILFSF